MCDIYFNFNLILYVVMRSRSYIGMLDCAILRNKYYYYYYYYVSHTIKDLKKVLIKPVNPHIRSQIMRRATLEACYCFDRLTSDPLQLMHSN